LGISATASIEDSGARRNALWDAGTNALSIGSFPGPNGTSVIGSTVCNAQIVTPDAPPGIAAANLTGCATGDYAANQIPDLVANLRVDQGWGSAQIAGALHQVRAGPYGNQRRSACPKCRFGRVHRPGSGRSVGLRADGRNHGACSHRRRRQGLGQRRV